MVINMNDSWKIDGLAWVLVDTKLTIILPSGESKTICADDSNFEKVLDAIKENNWEIIPDLVSVKEKISSFSEGNFEVKNNRVYFGDIPVPIVLSDKIIEYAKQNLPYKPLIKFWENLNQNPSNRSVEQLYGFLTKYNHPITPDGCFIAYKGVKDNYMDCHTGKTHRNMPGDVVSMPRNQVNENPNETCSHGLHVASYEYVNRFYGGISQKTVMVKVNPKDVVSVPVDYNNAKMRVCEYVVLEEIQQEVKTSLYPNVKNDSDDYAEEDKDKDKDEFDSYDDEIEDDTNDDECSSCGSELEFMANYCSECGAQNKAVI
jgi:hypothetical protein